MRDLDSQAFNRITLNDARSGTSIELTYRTPTTQEEVDYQAKAYRRKGKKLLVNSAMKVNAALAIITGIREGDFGVAGKPISSDPASDNYRQDWKQLLKATATDILLVFAAAIYEGTRVENDFAADLDYEVVDEDDLPLAKNSGE